MTDVEGFPLEIVVHPAPAQYRDGAPGFVQGVLAKAPGITRIWADSGYASPRLAKALQDLDISADIEIVRKVKESKGFEALPRRWVVERTFSWTGRCRHLSRDYERTLASAQGGGDAGGLPVSDASDCLCNRGKRNGISTIATYDSNS